MALGDCRLGDRHAALGQAGDLIAHVVAAGHGGAPAPGHLFEIRQVVDFSGATALDKQGGARNVQQVVGQKYRKGLALGGFCHIADGLHLAVLQGQHGPLPGVTLELQGPAQAAAHGANQFDMKTAQLTVLVDELEGRVIGFLQGNQQCAGAGGQAQQCTQQQNGNSHKALHGSYFTDPSVDQRQSNAAWTSAGERWRGLSVCSC